MGEREEDRVGLEELGVREWAVGGVGLFVAEREVHLLPQVASSRVGDLVVQVHLQPVERRLQRGERVVDLGDRCDAAPELGRDRVELSGELPVDRVELLVYPVETGRHLRLEVLELLLQRLDLLEDQLLRGGP